MDIQALFLLHHNQLDQSSEAKAKRPLGFVGVGICASNIECGMILQSKNSWFQKQKIQVDPGAGLGDQVEVWLRLTL